MKSLRQIFAEEKNQITKAAKLAAINAQMDMPKPTIAQQADMHKRINKVSDFLKETAKDFAENGYVIALKSGAAIERKSPENGGKSNFLQLHHVFTEKVEGKSQEHLLTIEIRSELDPVRKQKPITHMFCSKSARQSYEHVYEKQNGKMRIAAKELVRREIAHSLLQKNIAPYQQNTLNLRQKP